MQPSPQTASTAVQTSRAGTTLARKTEDLIYQVVTVAAVLLLLGSLWVF